MPPPPSPPTASPAPPGPNIQPSPPATASRASADAPADALFGIPLSTLSALGACPPPLVPELFSVLESHVHSMHELKAALAAAHAAPQTLSASELFAQALDASGSSGIKVIEMIMSE